MRKILLWCGHFAADCDLMIERNGRYLLLRRTAGKTVIVIVRNFASRGGEARIAGADMIRCAQEMFRRMRLKLRAIPCFVIFGVLAPVCAARNGAQNPPQTGAAAATHIETLPDWSDPELAKFVYSVVSIKPFKGDDNQGRSLGTRATPDGYTAAFPVQGLIYEAYKTDHYKIVGGTGWIQSEMYVVEAKMDPEVMEALQKLPSQKRRIARQHMLQVLLRDYFKVVVRTEIRDVPAYDLVIAKKGSKLTQAADADPAHEDFKRSTEGTMQLFNVKGEPVNVLLGLLEAETGRPVADKTGLTGNYDFSLKYTPKQYLMDTPQPEDSAPLPQTAPPIEKALEDQLGLKLSSTTGQMEFIIIDHAERPSGN
jgi:uncharacterized protein (TIGR03435 family)